MEILPFGGPRRILFDIQFNHGLNGGLKIRQQLRVDFAYCRMIVGNVPVDTDTIPEQNGVAKWIVSTTKRVADHGIQSTVVLPVAVALPVCPW
jgi:hypothetical protein